MTVPIVIVVLVFLVLGVLGQWYYESLGNPLPKWAWLPAAILGVALLYLALASGTDGRGWKLVAAVVAMGVAVVNRMRVRKRSE